MLRKPTQTTHPDSDKHKAVTAIWSKKNLMVIGLLQGTIPPALWPDFASLNMAKEIWDALETRFGKAGGAQTYLQLVNMITIKMTNLENLLMQIQEFQENYTRILTNGHSTFSEILSHSLSAPHYHCLMKRQHTNTWIISMILSSTNYQKSSPESSRKRIIERLTLSPEAHPSTSSPQ